MAWVQQAVTGYRAARVTDTPARLVRAPMGGCAFPAPSPTARVALVHVAAGVQSAPIYALTDEALAKAAQDYVQAYAAHNGAPPAQAGRVHTGPLGLVNVVVTETEAPVYLILVANSGLVWNLTVAEGAQIETVALLGPETIGLANAPDGVRVQALTGPAAVRCGARPARMPQDHWGFVRDMEARSRSRWALAALDENRAFARAFSAYLARTFNISQSRRSSGAHKVSNIIVGPVLEPAPAFASLDGAQILVTPVRHVIVGGPRDFEAGARAKVVEAARRAAGGDLSRLLGAHQAP